jgi:hypothetical protein
VRYRDVHEEAAAKKRAVTVLLSSSAELEVIAAFYASEAGKILESVLERHVTVWQEGGAWGSLDDEAKREQGSALRSRELLRYLRGAEETAKQQREEADRLVGLLETAADQGRIPRL